MARGDTGNKILWAGIGGLVGYVVRGASGIRNFVLPAGHKPGMRVPKGGSSCANCRFASVQPDGPYCTEKNFIKWNGGTGRLPVNDASTYCSDWWEPNSEAEKQIKREGGSAGVGAVVAQHFQDHLGIIGGHS